MAIQWVSVVGEGRADDGRQDHAITAVTYEWDYSIRVTESICRRQSQR
jgi:hypothetical protein